MVHLVIHFVWKERWSEMRKVRFMGSGQWPGRKDSKISYKKFWGRAMWMEI